ncbi:molecular chaperone [Arcobacter sp. CECT 8985]|uniref:TorD/DmsD family molecular chaperone n=1 Tax=Arcobacter sp. CECT 8985 TaxID=1935424 RepID=UPI00100C1E0B|nr:molecular chaperone TorD family protein [Arcobacter sp. CECT 8985]RXJ86067.1 hypothetical protein CRU93_10430 [Arcobacter sp. CECT 8985]
MDNIIILGNAASIFSQFLYNPPSKEQWDKIKEQKVLLEWFIHSDEKDNKKVLQLWQKSHNEESHLDISVDYTDMFICDEMYLKAPPFASFYLDISGELYSKEADNAKNIYKKCSFFTKSLLTQPADFIAIELEFISTLLLNIKRDEVFKKVLISFLQENFLPWVYSWTNDVKTNAKSSFYKGLGYHIEDFCDMLVEEFSIQNYEKKVYRTAS